MSERSKCELCGREDHDVSERVVRWTDRVVSATGRPRYESVLRCPDFQACRARVEKGGSAWLLVDAVTRPTVRTAPDREEVPI